MASILSVGQLQGLAENSNTITLPAGHTLDASAGGFSTPAGHVLQVIQAVQPDKISTNASSFANAPGLVANITPSSASSKILITLNVSVGTPTGRAFTSFRVLRDGTTPVGVGTDVTGNQCMFMVYPSGTNPGTDNEMATGNGQYLDSPNTTNQIQYQVQWMTPGTTVVSFLNRNIRNNGADYEPSAISTLTLMEIAG